MIGIFAGSALLYSYRIWQLQRKSNLPATGWLYFWGGYLALVEGIIFQLILISKE